MTSAAAQRTGLVFAALCALNGAFVPGVSKFNTDRADPLFVAVATTLFAGFAGALVLAVRGDLGRLVRRPAAPLLVLVGLLGTALPFALFFLGTARTSAITAVMCLQSEPAYSLLLAWLVLGHRLTLRRVGAALLLLSGILLAVSGAPREAVDPVGVAMLLATPLCWQVSHLFVLRRLVGFPPEVLTGARYVFGGLLLAPALAWGGGALLPSVDALRAQAPWLALQGLVLSYLGTMLWYNAIARIDLARATALVVPSIPLLSLGASFLLVGEVPTPRQVVGMLVTVAGVLAFVRAPHAVEKSERIPTATAPIAIPDDPSRGGDEA